MVVAVAAGTGVPSADVVVLVRFSSLPLVGGGRRVEDSGGRVGLSGGGACRVYLAVVGRGCLGASLSHFLWWWGEGRVGDLCPAEGSLEAYISNTTGAGGGTVKRCCR